METKIKQKLEKAGLELSDLTQEELQELKDEIAIEDKGEFVLDGVLHRVSKRKFKEMYRAEMRAIFESKE